LLDLINILVYNFKNYCFISVGRDSVLETAILYDWTVPGSNPSGGEIFRAVQTDPEAHPASYAMDLPGSN